MRLSGSACTSPAQEKEETSNKPTRRAQVSSPRSPRIWHSLWLLTWVVVWSSSGPWHRFFTFFQDPLFIALDIPDPYFPLEFPHEPYLRFCLNSFFGVLLTDACNLNYVHPSPFAQVPLPLTSWFHWGFGVSKRDLRDDQMSTIRQSSVGMSAGHWGLLLRWDRINFRINEQETQIWREPGSDGQVLHSSSQL